MQDNLVPEIHMNMMNGETYRIQRIINIKVAVSFMDEEILGELLE